MKASSKSGECASLISIVLPLACRVVIVSVVRRFFRPPADTPPPQKTLAPKAAQEARHAGRKERPGKLLNSLQNFSQSGEVPPQFKQKSSISGSRDQEAAAGSLLYSFFSATSEAWLLDFWIVRRGHTALLISSAQGAGRIQVERAPPALAVFHGSCR